MKYLKSYSSMLGQTAFARHALTFLGGSLFIGGLSSVHAGGLYLYEVSTTETAMAGAGWAARAQDATTAFTNPAGMSRLSGTQIQATIAPMYLNGSFDSDTGQNTDFSNWLPNGSFFATHEINDQWSVGFAMSGYFGLALDYGSQWDGRYYVDDVKLQSMNFQPTVSYQVNDEWSVGVGVAMVYTEFEQTMSLDTLLTSGDGKLKLKDNDISTQVNIGVMYEPTDETRFGLQYMSESDVNLNTKAKVKNVGAVGALLSDRKLDLGLTLPQTVMLSAFHQLTDDFAVMGNVGWQNWSQFGKPQIDTSEVDMTADMNYKDTWNFALGVQYQVHPQWRINSGVAYDTEMYDSDAVTPSLPSGDTWRYGIGLTYDYSDRLQYNVGYEINWTGDLSMDVDRGPLAGELDGHYEDIAISFFSFSVTWLL
jgi:long-chain fatty acid transport protein